MKLKIVKDNKPSLRKKTIEVPLPLSKEDKELLMAMNEYLLLSQDEEYASKHNIRAGVGLAAPQIGVNKRMFVINYEDNDKRVVHILVNPKIIETSARKVALSYGEGCLSVDKEHQGLSHRYYKIKMKAYDVLKEEEVIISAEGFESIVLQHEYDHLDGILFYDRIDPFNPNLQKPNEVLL